MIKNLRLDNIKGGLKTTLLGAALILFSLYMVYEELSEAMDYVMSGGILTTGITLFFVSDKKDGKVSNL